MEHVEGLLQKGIRIDARKLDEFREVSFVCREPGSVETHIGNSKALGECVVEPVSPGRSRPDQGIFNIRVNFLEMANPNFYDSRGPRDLIEIGKVVERGLLSTRAIDVDGLVIIRGKLVWKITVCVHIINDCGNLMDLVSITAISALLTAVRREVQICGTDVKILTPEERKPVPLAIHHIPITVSFGITDSGVPLLDPSEREESVCKSRLTIAINKEGEVCAVQKSGTPISMKVIQRCCDVCFLI
ncbi:exosome complex exonuclease RRP45, putative [Entamoeba dispar SAW760]|uniref:Exosome complex exonuclease RRP45, putative n=1 Tax=Entamoeba dispar (strain ATCC PRA-260 / SAW760) TaxID=370354 RepID=B0EPW9_ENTDS|nr:exosome complex exonuclease RRP45, putative [Entamoeba dispar SAW760]EDR23438.1 exosome complex exonuclease RRP45, putative [Entamoeba dispar SAW760]|eukprot:EDR23438.1 exosome complex exonuclease RRP45, putative [Entamoeba dispar SAW760]